MENREAIASLKTLCNTCTMYPKCVNDKPECFQAIEMAISALKKLEQDKWIPCKERLPELGVDVLITDEYGDVLQATYTEWLGSESFISAEESIIIEDVIAWRPLPEPYTEEES